jgi:hypothetical protein
MMTKQEILDRVQDILNQEGNVQALDLLRHDLENDIIESKIDYEVSAEYQWRKNSKIKEQFNGECD